MKKGAWLKSKNKLYFYFFNFAIFFYLFLHELNLLYFFSKTEKRNQYDFR